MGGTPSPPLTESPLSFSGNFFPKRTKNDVFGLNKVKMDQKGHIIDQKGLKMYEKRQKMEFSDLKYLLFSRIFLSGIGGTPPPLTENHPAQKPLAEMGGTPPLNGKKSAK